MQKKLCEQRSFKIFKSYFFIRLVQKFLSLEMNVSFVLAKEELQIEEERKLVSRERKILESNWIPDNTNDFDRLVAGTPNSSILWIRYIWIYLQLFFKLFVKFYLKNMRWSLCYCEINLSL